MRVALVVRDVDAVVVGVLINVEVADVVCVDVKVDVAVSVAVLDREAVVVTVDVNDVVVVLVGVVVGVDDGVDVGVAVRVVVHAWRSSQPSVPGRPDLAFHACAVWIRRQSPIALVPANAAPQSATRPTFQPETSCPKPDAWLNTLCMVLAPDTSQFAMLPLNFWAW